MPTAFKNSKSICVKNDTPKVQTRMDSAADSNDIAKSLCLASTSETLTSENFGSR